MPSDANTLANCLQIINSVDIERIASFLGWVNIPILENVWKIDRRYWAIANILLCLRNFRNVYDVMVMHCFCLFSWLKCFYINTIKNKIVLYKYILSQTPKNNFFCTIIIILSVSGSYTCITDIHATSTCMNLRFL